MSTPLDPFKNQLQTYFIYVLATCTSNKAVLPCSVSAEALKCCFTGMPQCNPAFNTALTALYTCGHSLCSAPDNRAAARTRRGMQEAACSDASQQTLSCSQALNQVVSYCIHGQRLADG